MTQETAGVRHLKLGRRDINLAFESLTKALEQSELFEKAIAAGSQPDAIQAVFYMQELINRARETLGLGAKAFVAAWQEISREYQFSQARKAQHTAAKKAVEGPTSPPEEPDEDDDEDDDSDDGPVM